MEEAWKVKRKIYVESNFSILFFLQSLLHEYTNTSGDSGENFSESRTTSEA